MPRQQTFNFRTTTSAAYVRLEKSLGRLGATDIKRGMSDDPDRGYKIWITFRYDNAPYKFEYSTLMATYKNYKVRADSEIFIALVNGISQLALLAERGIFSFGQEIAGFKQIEFIEVPQWAKFMGFNTVPRNVMEAEDRFKELVKGPMNPNTNPEDYQKLQQARIVYRQYFKVE